MHPVCVLLGVAIIVSCEDSHSPTTSNALGKDSFDWTVDTITYPNSFQTCMRSIYGTDPNDIYVVGHNDLNRGMAFHYDGSVWSPIALTSSEGGVIGKSIDLYAVHGTSTHDLWVVGYELFLDPVNQRIIDSSLVLHFDGVQWREMEIVDRGGTLACVWAAAINSVWTGGTGGVVLNWNGTRW